MSDVNRAALAGDDDGMVLAQGTSFGPAYDVGGSAISGSKNLPCSMYATEFCFLCWYEGSAVKEGMQVDLYTALVALCQKLAQQKREVSQIAFYADEMYVNNIQEHVADNPAWSRESIVRHLVHSGQFQPVFDDSVRMMFTSLITRINSSLIDKDTNQIIPENRKAFLETVTKYMQYCRHVNQLK